MLSAPRKGSLQFVVFVCLVSSVKANNGEKCRWTGRNCIRSCDGLEDGNYQSCHGCHIYASCVAGSIIDRRPCNPTSLQWEDTLSRCEHNSSTCVCYPSPTTVRIITTEERSQTSTRPTSSTKTKVVTSSDRPTQTQRPSTPTTSSHADSTRPSRRSVLGLLTVTMTYFLLAM